MALTFPYPLDFLNDYLREGSSTLSIQRNDELSGSGDGRYWTAELARPLWTITLPLVARRPAEARALDAKIIALNGSAKTLLWADPSYAPAFGATVELALATVTVASISTDRTALAFTGLPSGWVLSTGDRFSIVYGERYYLATISEDATADSAGATGEVSVFPYLPFGVSIGAVAEIVRPVMKCLIPPSGYTGFTFQPGNYGDGASLTLLQKP